ncbi:transcriptional regulator [Mycobacterium angelicum]|uniref:Transcriptional regulator n=2 Tax=Mycobacterium angelicum TaxID=470074 RepID=A0A1W9ZL99_MYCAN|nr:MarR family transcriptional regulator [Mycobacterium angelicum]ORA17666.1 transcriptional regulator [Mycobacterium angelicum]
MVATPKYRAPQTDLGTAMRVAWWSYVRRVDDEMEAAGFPDRSYSILYVFVLYAQPAPITISEIGRLFGISRQAASKVVAELRDRGYVQTTTSTTDQREKVVELTQKANDFMTARLRTAGALDRAIRKRIGDDGLEGLIKGLHAVTEVARGTTESEPGYIFRPPKLW